MTDQQLLTLALSIVIPIAISGSAVIYSNSRINDAKETLRAGIQALRAEMRAGFERIEMPLKIHEI